MRRSFTLAQLAELTSSSLSGDPHYLIYNVADLESATPQDASFLNKLPFGQTSRYVQMMRKSEAGVIFVSPDVERNEARNYLIHEDPSRAFQTALEAFNTQANRLTGFTGIHPTAVIHPSAKIGLDVHVAPHVVIDSGVIVADNVHIGAGTYIGPNVQIGAHTIIHPRVTIRENCQIGDRVIIQPGAVIGSCGFGYTTDKQGRHTKLNQIGNVILEDDVEVGANTTIDRSRFKSTRISRGTKIDNLVQIGHGAQLGDDNIIAAQTGISGSTKTGRLVVMGGQCGLIGHIEIGDNTTLTARTGVDKSLPTGKYGGAPCLPLAEHHRITIHLRNIVKTLERIKALETRLHNLENSASLQAD